MRGAAGLPGTDQAGLLGNKPEMGLVAVAAQLGEGQHALVDGVGAVLWGLLSYPSQRGSLARRGRRFARSCLSRPDGVEDALEGLLDLAGVVSDEGVLGR